MGVNENDESSVAFIPTDKVEEVFNKYIKKQIIIQGDKVTENNEAFLIDIKKEETLAKDASYERRLPLFVGEKDNQTYYIVPMRGKGLWDAIWGYIAIDTNMVVKGVFFDHKGETPGLGANINQRFFMDDFEGEKVTKNGTIQGVAVKKGNADPKNMRKDDYAVDAIAGATITGVGVSAMIKKDLKLYASYFNSLKK
jgi:Na+-transporting NADH:ubiquinone oxidoreductase subunit C